MFETLERKCVMKETGTRLDQQAGAVAVVAAFEFHQQVASGMAARQADGAHGGLGTGRNQAHHLQRGREAAEDFRQFDFSGNRRAEGKAIGGNPLYGLDDFGVRVSQAQRPPRSDIIQILPPFHVGEARAFSLGEKTRRAANGTKSAHRRIHAARDVLLGAFKQLGMGAHEISLKSCW